MLREKERAMICRKDMAVSQHNMWLIVSLTTLISASSLLLQTQVILLFQIWQQHQSNLRLLKDAVTAQNSGRTRYRRMKLKYVLFSCSKSTTYKQTNFDCLM